MSFSKIVPAPIRDIVFTQFEIRNCRDDMRGAQPGSADAALIGVFGGGVVSQPLAAKLIGATSRVALAAIGAYAVSSFGLSLPVAAVLSGIVSLPALSIAGGSWILYHGVAASVSALATGSFTTLGIGVACLAGGWITLENYDVAELGLAEQCVISPLCTKYSEPLLKLFN